MRERERGRERVVKREKGKKERERRAEVHTSLVHLSME